MRVALRAFLSDDSDRKIKEKEKKKCSIVVIRTIHVATLEKKTGTDIFGEEAENQFG